MNVPAPATIRLTAPTELTLTWAGSPPKTLPLKLLRDECPCAGCKGEVILGKVFKPLQLPTFTPGMYELKSIDPVGNYAVQVTWQDGHHTGIYSWEYLHLLCEQVMKP